ncbi:M12 family metallopeptidase [Chitinophaga cymbidii]|uniref:Peptidase M12A domain-containing protein n=1 Tax=Chitinophaga cymbidii TaxID=1096750 RepID=A0A512RLT3_9BACT|nr:M12 family metallopeptidase [Chitinophaga cymbidii]GEP96671.1 hypothetical protein CCY01nite_29310 [Chitinophaga cymbidii]
MKTLSKVPVFVLVAMAGLVSTFTACKKSNSSEPPIASSPDQSCGCENEIAYKDIPGEVVSFTNKMKNVTFELIKKGDKYILGGDIILTAEQVARLKGETDPGGRTGVNSIAQLWPDRTVFFTINPGLANQSRVTDAIAHWESVTNLQFVQRTTQANFIEFVTGTGCFSNYGMTGGRQEINLHPNCTMGNVIHEIGHAIGFYHEHMRKDRDSYITVHYNNIQPSSVTNFYKYTELGLGGFEIGTLDFGSVMMYGSDFFQTAPGLWTITRLDGSTFNAQRVGLSPGDIQTYNNMYNRPFMRLETSNYQYQIPIQNGWRDSYDVHIRAYANAAMTIPATLTIPIIFKVSMDWYRTGIPPYSTITEITMQPGQDEYFCGTAFSEATFEGGQISESNVIFGFNPLVY